MKGSSPFQSARAVCRGAVGTVAEPEHAGGRLSFNLASAAEVLCDLELFTWPLSASAFLPEIRGNHSTRVIGC